MSSNLPSNEQASTGANVVPVHYGFEYHGTSQGVTETGKTVFQRYCRGCGQAETLYFTGRYVAETGCPVYGCRCQPCTFKRNCLLLGLALVLVLSCLYARREARLLKQPPTVERSW